MFVFHFNGLLTFSECKVTLLIDSFLTPHLIFELVIRYLALGKKTRKKSSNNNNKQKKGRTVTSGSQRSEIIFEVAFSLWQ